MNDNPSTSQPATQEATNANEHLLHFFPECLDDTPLLLFLDTKFYLELVYGSTGVFSLLLCLQKGGAFAVERKTKSISNTTLTSNNRQQLANKHIHVCFECFGDSPFLDLFHPVTVFGFHVAELVFELG